GFCTKATRSETASARPVSSSRKPPCETQIVRIMIRIPLHMASTMQPPSRPLPRPAFGVSALLCFGCATTAFAQSTDPVEPPAFERLTVIGTRPAEQTGGSASYIAPEQLERFRHTD